MIQIALINDIILDPFKQLSKEKRAQLEIALTALTDNLMPRGIDQAVKDMKKSARVSATMITRNLLAAA